MSITDITSDIIENAALYYREGSSDKVYHASLRSEGPGYVVEFAYGRRGAALKTGTKTAKPVDLESARAIYTKLVREKTSKGYVPDQQGVPFSHPETSGQASGISCQLLNPIDRATAEALARDDGWFMQEKMDGVRLLARKEAGRVDGINRRGLISALAREIETDLMTFEMDLLPDGEAVGTIFNVFDLLSLGGQDLRALAFETRLALLEATVGTRALAQVRLVPTARTTEEKLALLARVERDGGEGVVLKRRDAAYVAGRPASGGSQLKFKLWETATVRVAEMNDQRSVMVELHDGAAWRSAGNVTIPANHPIPRPGQLAEIRYLYAFRESSSLYQPTYLGIRDDLEESAAVLAQLKFKPT